jgi:hypothetical protein
MPVLRSKVEVRSAKCELLTSMCVAPSPLGASVDIKKIFAAAMGPGLVMCNEQHHIGSEKGGGTGKRGKLETELANGLRLATSCYTIRGRRLLAHTSRRVNTALKSTLVNTTILND